jgi:RND family efflux transporter MFP subunit
MTKHAERRAARAAALALAALAAACGADPHERRPGFSGEPVEVRAEAVDAGAWSEGLEVTGTIAAFRRASPGTVLMGRVEAVLRREGDRVVAGEPLARIEVREVTARLAQAEAGVAAARAQEDNARITLERMERLHARQAAPRKAVDDAVAGHDAARAARQAAEAAVEAGRSSVGHGVVRAPFAGTVTERRIEAGDLASPGMPLFVVEDLSRVKVEAHVAESLAHGFVPGAVVRVEVPSAGVAIDGTVTEVLPAADPASRTLAVRVVLDNAGGDLRPGMFARLALAGVEARAVSIPEAAVVRRGPLAGVFVVAADGTARLRWLSLGTARDGRIRVLAGLEAGSRVVVSPPAALEDGRPVRVL